MFQPEEFIVVAEVGYAGSLLVNGLTLHSVEEFFSSPPSRYFSVNSYKRVYTLTLDTQEPLKLLTKKRLREEFADYADTDMYEYLN